MIEGAFFSLLVFFFTLGLFHGLEEVEVNGKRYRAAPVFQPLALVLFFALMLAFMVPGLGALVAAAIEPTAATIRIQQTTNGTLAVTYTNRPPAAAYVQEPVLGWQYWIYVLCAGIFPVGGYYAGYNLAMWLDAKQTLPFLIRYPLFRIVEEEPQEEVVVEEVPRRKREETHIILKGDLF
jgi:hypothetical protein